MNEKYKDIMNMQPPTPPNGIRMTAHDRAAQFAPFAALSGFDDAVEETARTTDGKMCMNEDEIDRIDMCLRELAADIDKKPGVNITYFVPDNKKSGGRYVTETRRVKRIDIPLGTITLMPPMDNSSANLTVTSANDLTLNLSDVVNLLPTAKLDVTH